MDQQIVLMDRSDLYTGLIIVFAIIAIYYVFKYITASKFNLLFTKKKIRSPLTMTPRCGVPYHHEKCGCYTRPRALVYNGSNNAPNSASLVVAPFSGPSFYSAHQNNTLEQRPGNYSALLTYGDLHEPPAGIVKLIYQKGCNKHPLVAMFWHMKDQYEADETNPSSRIKFVAEIADPADSYNWGGPFPKLLKIRPSGQVLEYQGHVNFGAIADWIRDERILFSGPYY